jgi:hypothetical protein
MTTIETKAVTPVLESAAESFVEATANAIDCQASERHRFRRLSQ